MIPRVIAVGELWFAGRFRCAAYWLLAFRPQLIERGQLRKTLERWSLGEPFVAERLRRHWRFDPCDWRDCPAWFRRQ